MKQAFLPLPRLKSLQTLAAAATCAAALLLAPAAARAEVEHYEFDKAHTQIIFSVSHLGFSHSHGRFLDFDGGFSFDREKPENSAVSVTIRTAGLEMNDKAWNDHLKNEDFFNVEKHPEMTFKSTAIKVTGDKTADMTGDLTLLGVTKPVTLHVTHNKSDKFPFGDRYVSGFSAAGTLKRSDFGMTYGLPGVSDDVALIIEVEGIRKDPAAPETAAPETAQ